MTTTIPNAFGTFTPYGTSELPTILVDMDGVICDWQEQFDTLLANMFPHIEIIPRDEIKVFKSQSLYAPEHHAAIATMMNSEGFYRTLRPIEGAVAALHEMAKEYNVLLCTAPYVSNETCASEKMLWVEKYLGVEWKEKMVITSDKTVVRGDILIDDKPNIKGSMSPLWKHVVFDAPYNRDMETRIDKWADWRVTVEAVIQSLVKS